MSTTAELTQLVRDITDLDEADLPSALIRTFLRDGFDRFINLERRWPWLETSATLNTVANQRAYAVSAIGAGTFREIVSVTDTSLAGNRLHLIPIEDAERIYNGALDTPSRPLYYLEWADNIQLYPKPDTVYPLSIRGYRKPTYEWLTNTALSPDCDERLHLALAYYAIAQAYKRQEDSELMAMHKQSYDEAVAIARKELMRPSSHRPMVLSKGSAHLSFRGWLQELGRTLGQ